MPQDVGWRRPGCPSSSRSLRNLTASQLECLHLQSQTGNSISVGHRKNDNGYDLWFPETVEQKSLLQLVKSRFEKIVSPVQTREFTLTHYLMSALAMFRLKYPFLLKFDRDTRQNNPIRAKREPRFGVLKVPFDTAMRKVLDWPEPARLRPLFKALLAFVPRGKI